MTRPLTTIRPDSRGCSSERAGGREGRDQRPRLGDGLVATAGLPERRHQEVHGVPGSVQQSHLSSQFVFQCCNLQQHSEKCTISAQFAFLSSVFKMGFEAPLGVSFQKVAGL